MSRTFNEVTEEALRLPETEQLMLARTLIESVEASGEAGVEEAWEREIERRIQEVDDGLAKGRPFSEVIRRVDSLLIHFRTT